MEIRNHFSFFKNKDLKFKLYFILIIFISLLIFVFDSFSILTLLPIVSMTTIAEGTSASSYANYIPDYLLKYIYELGYRTLFLVLITIFFLRNTFHIFNNFILYKFTKYINIDTSKKTFFLSINKKFLDFYNQNSSEIIKDLRDSVSAYTMFIENIIKIISDFLILLLFTFFLFYLSSKETIFIFIYFLFIFIIFNRLVSKISLTYGKKENLNVSRINFIIINAYKNFAQIILRNLKKNYLKLFTNVIIEYSVSRLFISFIKSNTKQILEIFILIFVIIVFYFLDHFYDKENLLMLITIYLVAFYRMLPIINSLTASFIKLKNLEFPYKIINSQINLFNKRYKKIRFSRKKIKKQNFFKNIELKNISFKYKSSENHIIKNLNLKIKKNEMIGIYGQSGYGKSTVAKILVALLDPLTGQRLVDGKKINSNKVDEYQSLFGYLPQENLFIPGTVKENIAFGDEEIDEKKLIMSLKKANCLEFINKLRDKINHKLVEDGKNFSAGQLQRLALARTIYFDNEIIVLDEPTSSLDLKAEYKFITLVNTLKKYKTIIIISHKIKTLKKCNKVFELKNKKLSRRKLN